MHTAKRICTAASGSARISATASVAARCWTLLCCICARTTAHARKFAHARICTHASTSGTHARSHARTHASGTHLHLARTHPRICARMHLHARNCIWHARTHARTHARMHARTHASGTCIPLQNANNIPLQIAFHCKQHSIAMHTHTDLCMFCSQVHFGTTTTSIVASPVCEPSASPVHH